MTTGSCLRSGATFAAGPMRFAPQHILCPTFPLPEAEVDIASASLHPHQPDKNPKETPTTGFVATTIESPAKKGRLLDSSRGYPGSAPSRMQSRRG
jgi:hypothetical protein